MTNERHWYIAIVAPNTEAAAAARLSQDYTVFLPAQKVVSVWKDGRRKLREKILIPGKLLVYCTERERIEILQLSLAKRFMVDIAGTPNEHGRRPIAIVPPKQVEQLKMVLAQMEAKVWLSADDFTPGEPVRLLYGPMAGLEGTVADWNSKTTRLRIHINHLGCAQVEVNVEDLEKL